MVNKQILENKHDYQHVGSSWTHMRTNMWANCQRRLMVYVIQGDIYMVNYLYYLNLYPDRFTVDVM